MRQVLLNGKYYKLTSGSEILERAINPWKAQIRQTGGLEYSDFGQAELEEYHDFRGGIGRKRGLGSEARLDWSEGIDFTTEGQAVLGGLVNTAGWYNLAFTGGITSNINCGAIHNAATTLWISLWFKLDAAFVAGSTTQVIFGLREDSSNYLQIYLANADGKLHYIHLEGGATLFDLETTQTSWVADTWYHVIASMSAAEGARLRVNNGTALTDADVTALSIIGNFIIGSATDGASQGFIGQICDFVIGTDDLSAAEETALYAGTLPGDETDEWPIDEGTGTTITSYGSNGNAGTADSACTWTADTRPNLTPLKIIDFLDETYIITHKKIGKWNATNSVIDVVFREGIIITSCEDAWTTDQGANVVCSASATKVEGTYSALMQIGAAVGAAAAIAHFDIAEADFSSQTTVSFWIYVSADIIATDYDILLQDGGVTKATVNIPATTLAAGWTRHNVTVSLSAATDIDSVKLYQTNDKGAINIFLDFIVAGVGLISTPIDAIVVTDSTDSYLVVSTAESAIYSIDGSIWKILVGCQGYLTFYATKLKSIDTDGSNFRSSAANNIDGTWTSFALTGNFGTVYDLFEGKLLSDGSSAIYFCGNQGLYTIDITNEIAYRQEVEYPPLTYSGHVGKYWNANVWVATGYGILKVTPSLATYIGPDQDDGLPSGYQGYIYDMVTVNNWLVYCVNGGTSDKSSILKRSSTLGGNLQVYTTSAINKPIACLLHSPSSLYTNGRLWFGEGTDIKYMMFPDVTSNVKQVSTYQYVNDSGYGKFPIFRKLATIPKVALGVAAITKSCDADDYIEVFYGLNEAAPTTSLGTLKSSPHPTTLTFGSGLGVAFYTIQLAIKLFRNGGNTTSPELESLILYWYATPVRISAWQLDIEAIGENSSTKFTEFETIRDTNTLVAFYPSGDPNKTSFNVKLTQMPSREWWENQGARAGYFTVILEEIFKG